ncbi:potassium voltage-gated channel subfamily c member [Plakobranchus ocellatus]|uniref:Potassium voltage-gated channel subfamily c member n=1 Tax=Plakobranchus ocellatus TaxID=259542 RepID=A0AAV4C693_9GAST|nr:potassium voltage-gated channel subfamily c member [Plakobranchus ocellatus]
MCVLLSIFVLIASTDRIFMRDLTQDEWLDYFNDDETLVYAHLLNLPPDQYRKDKQEMENEDDESHNQGDPHDRPGSQYHDETSSAEITTAMPDLEDSTLTSYLENTTQETGGHQSGAQPPSHVGKRSVKDYYRIFDKAHTSQTEPREAYAEPSPNKQNSEKIDAVLTKGNNTIDENNNQGYIPYQRSFKPFLSRYDDEAQDRNVRNFLNSFIHSFTKDSNMHKESGFKISRIIQEAINSESLKFEIRIMDGNIAGSADQADQLILKEKNINGQHPGRQVQFEETLETKIESQTGKDNDELTRKLVRHKRAPGNNGTSDNSTTGGNLTEVTRHACYIISGLELGKLIGIAYETGVSTGSSSSSTTTELPQNVFAVENWLSYIELACIVYFTIEFVVRLIFCPNKLYFILNFFTIVDVLSLLCMYTVLVLHHVNRKSKYTQSYVDVINCLQVVRLFRLFRLVKDVTGFRVLVFSVKTSWRELLLLLLYTLMLVSIFASLAYYCERGNMGSIPRAAWWALVTMTTVGYGDIAPKTAIGRLVGAACAMSGVLLIAVTVPVFVNNFLLFYEHSKIIDQKERSQSEPVRSSKASSPKKKAIQDYKRCDSNVTTTTVSSTKSFSRQQSAIKPATIQLDGDERRAQTYTYANGDDQFNRQRKPRVLSSASKTSQVSFTKVKPAV